jgi:DNA helicase HerA-like ATPase
MTLAEGFSRIGVPVFLADVKGDVAGLAVAGTASEKLQQRADRDRHRDYAPAANPVVFWDLYGKLGHPVRTTVSEMGPTLLSRILELNDTQAGVLDIVFKLADDRGLLLLDLDDLRALLGLVADERKDISTEYGLVSAQSVGAIQRALLRLEQEGGDMFFGEPALELADLMRTTTDGRGVIGILAADQLILKPRLYSTFLLWLLSELFENLPEVGDLDKPKLVFVFDEAHLLFDDAPAALQQRIEQVVRLIRSKGVGVYFCSQFPDDVPDNILGQLGNRVQHALRAFTPRDQKAVKTAAETFVPTRSWTWPPRHLATRHRRGAGLDPAGQGRADAGAADPGRAAALPDGRDHRCRARAGARRQPGRHASTTPPSTANPPPKCWRRSAEAKVAQAARRRRPRPATRTTPSRVASARRSRTRCSAPSAARA